MSAPNAAISPLIKVKEATPKNVPFLYLRIGIVLTKNEYLKSGHHGLMFHSLRGGGGVGRLPP